MTEQTIQNNITDAGMSVASFLFRIIATVTGGILGSVVLVLFIVLADTMLAPVLQGADEVRIGPVFVFIVMIMVFLSTLIGNITATFFTSLTDREKYKRRSTALTQIAVMSIIVVIFMLPVYFISATINVQLVIFAVALHMILTVLTSALTLEIVSNYRYSLVGLYGVTLSIIISSAALFLFSRIVSNVTILLFIALPVIWGTMGVIQGFTSMVYASLARLYDKDFLSTQTMYGDDYGKEVEEEVEEPVEQKLEEEEGASFLRK
ncbi:MAG: hypothetical protein RBS56_04910 [Candidatus Gracilibacteria bacterium]|jgi:hypothetical protein|nr:hypothetical protein [Candidatus Gracilibacteria bacterium]